MNGELPLWPGAAMIAGRYSTQEVIGIGGMGIVYLALDTKLQRRVALKVTRMGLSRANALRLYREAQAMAQLSHRNVVSVHDVGMWQGHVFLAMEYMEAGTLSRFLLANELGWREILTRFIEAGRGLAAAHEAGVVHRDFKTDNVLLSAADEVKVADFGLACLPGSEPVASGAAQQAPNLEHPDALRAHLTRLGTVLGTPGYMAPEQIRGRLVDHRADIWSFCAALYEALYCELPFPGRTPREVLRYAEAGGFRREPPGCRVPQWLRRTLLAGLRADPAQRISTMQGLLDLLERRASGGRDRGRKLLAGGVAVGLVGLAALGIHAGQREPQVPVGAASGAHGKRPSGPPAMGRVPSTVPGRVGDASLARVSLFEAAGGHEGGRSHQGESEDPSNPGPSPESSIDPRTLPRAGTPPEIAGSPSAVGSNSNPVARGGRSGRARGGPMAGGLLSRPTVDGSVGQTPATGDSSPEGVAAARRAAPPSGHEAPIILD